MGSLSSGLAVSTLTLAELARGPATASDRVVKASRERRICRAYQAFRSIAATALAHQLPLYTLNASDLRRVEGLIDVVDLS